MHGKFQDNHIRESNQDDMLVENRNLLGCNVVYKQVVHHIQLDCRLGHHNLQDFDEECTLVIRSRQDCMGEDYLQ